MDNSQPIESVWFGKEEQTIISLRDEPNSKLELLFDPRGRLGNGEERGPVYILRLWTLTGGPGWVKEIRLSPHEFTALLKAASK